MRRLLEPDVDGRRGLGHALARAEIKRYALPAPVVDVQLQRCVGLGGTTWIDVLFLEVAGHHLSVDHAARVLAAKGVGMHRVLRDGPDRFQHLHLLVTQRLGVHHRGRLHRDQREQLQQMALDHVTQRTRALVIIGAAFDAERLRVRDLHVIDVLAVPHGLEQEIGEAEHQDDLHRALTEVMIDAIDLAFLEVLVHALLQYLRAQQVVTEGLFDHLAPPAIVLVEQARIPEALNVLADIARAYRHVEDHICREARVLDQRGLEPFHRRAVVQITLQVVEPLLEEVEGLLTQRAAILLTQHAFHFFYPIATLPRTAAEGDDHHLLRQATRHNEQKQRRQQKATREKARRAEEHETTGLRHQCSPAFFTAWPPKALRIIDNKR